jgi:RNA polymerase sigma-70 factor (ECF subfamily)
MGAHEHDSCQPAGAAAPVRRGLYTPLLYYWARRQGLQQADAADLIQEVLVVLVRELPHFAYDRARSFRGWLRTLTLRKWWEKCRCQRPDLLPPDDPALEGLATPDTLETFAEEEYRQYLAQRALALMQKEFQPTTWKACWETVVSGRSAREVAAELGVRVEVVYASRSRVLRRLREELHGLLD